MLLTPPGIGQIAAVALQFRLRSVKRIQLFIRNCQDLGSLKTAGSAQRYHNIHELTGHCLILCHPRIHIGLAHTVVSQQLCLGIDLLHTGQILKQTFGRLPQLPGKSAQICAVIGKGCQFLLPSIIGGIEIFNGPSILYRNFGTGTNVIGSRHRCSLLESIFIIISQQTKKAICKM